jgi:hypothetical protein
LLSVLCAAQRFCQVADVHRRANNEYGHTYTEERKNTVWAALLGLNANAPCRRVGLLSLQKATADAYPVN